MAEFKDKFIGFIDILGFSKLVEESEAGRGMSPDELVELLKVFGTSEEGMKFEKNGPIICPQSVYLHRNLDFCLSKFSDSVVVSSEISPAGVINLINHCSGIVIRFLQKGIMCRGYITRGNIIHTKDNVIGTGYQAACIKERNVSFFKREADERATPFVEIDKVICEYVNKCNDSSVKKMFSRYVSIDEGVAALFPFKSIEHQFMISGFGKEFNPKEEKISNMQVRLMLEDFRNRILVYLDKSNPSAVKKVEHYICALNAQLGICNQADNIIDLLSKSPDCF